MGNKVMRRLVTVMVALALVLTSGMAAFAATWSPTTGKVSNVTTVGKYNKKTLKVTWSAVDGADSYNVYLNGKLWKKGGKNVKGTSTTLKGLKKGTRYNVVVKSVKGDKESVPSELEESNNIASDQLSKRWFKNIKIKKAKAGKGQATVSWKKVAGATGYQVIIYKNGKWHVAKTVGKKTKAVITGLEKGKKYKFKVRALKGEYAGIWSGTKTSGKVK